MDGDGGGDADAVLCGEGVGACVPTAMKEESGDVEALGGRDALAAPLRESSAVGEPLRGGVGELEKVPEPQLEAEGEPLPGTESDAAAEAVVEREGDAQPEAVGLCEGVLRGEADDEGHCEVLRVTVPEGEREGEDDEEGEGEAVKGDSVAQAEAVGEGLLVWGSVMVPVGVTVKAVEGLRKEVAEADAEPVGEERLLPVLLAVEVVEEEGVARMVGVRVWGEGDEERDSREGDAGRVGEATAEGEVEADMEAVVLNEEGPRSTRTQGARASATASQPSEHFVAPTVRGS